MTKFEKLLVVVAVALAAVIGVLVYATSKEPTPAPSTNVDTDANIGKCIQAQRVLYRVDRGSAAEACLAQLDAGGRATFDRTWRNFETEAGSW